MSAFENVSWPEKLGGRCNCKECGVGLLQIDEYLEPDEDSGLYLALSCSNCSLEAIDIIPHKELEGTLNTECDKRLLAALVFRGVQLREAEPIGDLHICPDCDRDLVYPVDWEESSDTHWEVLLRCPNCEWTVTGNFDQPTVDRFDEQLDVGTEILLSGLKRLERANREEEADLVAKAFAADIIDAETIINWKKDPTSDIPEKYSFDFEDFDY